MLRVKRDGNVSPDRTPHFVLILVLVLVLVLVLALITNTINWARWRTTVATC
jgi:hypothetical protein